MQQFHDLTPQQKQANFVIDLLTRSVNADLENNTNEFYKATKHLARLLNKDIPNKYKNKIFELKKELDTNIYTAKRDLSSPTLEKKIEELKYEFADTLSVIVNSVFQHSSLFLSDEVVEGEIGSNIEDIFEFAAKVRRDNEDFLKGV
jgi:ribosomal protein L4